MGKGAGSVVLSVATMSDQPNRLQNLRALRLANADGGFAVAFATLVTGTFQVGFIKLLGASDLWIGVLSAVPSLLGVLQIPGAVWGRRFPTYKKFVLPGGLIWRLFYVPLIVLPLVPLIDQAKLILLTLCVAIASASVLLVQPIYNEWLSEMVPQNSRGWFFSRRNAITTAVGALIGILGGVALDYFRKQGQEPLGLSVVYGAGIVCAAISLVMFWLMPDLRREHPVKVKLADSLRAMRKPFRDKEFRRVLLFLGFFFVGQTFAGNLYGAYALESLKLSFTAIQMTGVANAVGIVLAARFWGFLADRYGNKPILAISGIGIATNPISWLLTVPGETNRNIAILLVGHVFMGIFWAGVAVGQFNLLLATAKEEDKASYLGAGLALQSVVSGFSPLIGAGMMAILRLNLPVVLAYKGVFITALLLRASAVLFLAPVREEGSSRVRRTLRDLRKAPRGMRTMRTLARSSDTQERAVALKQVGRQGLTIASEEVVRSLSDPSPKVRRQASQTLAKLADPDSLRPLLEHIERHPDLVEEDTVEALGEIGSPKAVGPLIEMLDSPRSLLRRAAARALGKIGSEAAVSSLIACAAEQDDPDLQRASIQALRMIGSKECADVVSAALHNARPSVRIAAAEAVAELQLKTALPHLRQSLTQFQDEPSSEIAYALAAIGGLEEIPRILSVATTAKTTLARRRCLLGVARLIEVESDVYKLLLKTGMSRDTELANLLQPLAKRSRKIKAALDRYASGDEPAALHLLASATKDPVVQEIVEAGIRESFILLAPYLAQNWSPPSKNPAI